MLAVGAAGVFGYFCSRLSFLFSFSLSVGSGGRGILKYCLKGPLYHQLIIPFN